MHSEKSNFPPGIQIAFCSTKTCCFLPCLFQAFIKMPISQQVFLPFCVKLHTFTYSCLFTIICCCAVTKLCPTLCNPMDCSTPGLPVLHHLLEFAQIHVQSVMLSNHLILCPTTLFLLPLVFPSTRVFSNESALSITCPKYWSFRFSISPSNGYLALISFRIDGFDLLAVHGTLQSLLQLHNLKASILRHSTFFMVQFSHPYRTTGKTIALTICSFVSKMMSLLFSMLPRFVITFLPSVYSP